MNELMIVYQGDAALVDSITDYQNIPKQIFNEHSIIGADNFQDTGIIIAQSKVKVLVLHKMFLKDTVFVSQFSLTTI